MYPIVFIEHPTEAEYAAMCEGINDFARSQGFQPNAGGYTFAVYDDARKIIGMISGFDNFGPVEIGGLWVHENYRNQGLGRALVQKAEEWGRAKGCKAITVFTLKNWPAFSWYQSLGFTLEFERPNHSPHSPGCYLIKPIT